MTIDGVDIGKLFLEVECEYDCPDDRGPGRRDEEDPPCFFRVGDAARQAEVSDGARGVEIGPHSAECEGRGYKQRWDVPGIEHGGWRYRSVSPQSRSGLCSSRRIVLF